MLELLKKMLKAQFGDDQAGFNTAWAEAQATYKAEMEANDAGLKSKTQELMDKLAKAKKNQIPEGVTAEDYQAYIDGKDALEAEKKEAADAKLASEGRWDELKNEMTTAHSTAMNTLKTESEKTIASLKAALDTETITNQAHAAIKKVQGSEFLLMPHIVPSVRNVAGEDGVYSLQVVDSAGQQRFDAETGKAVTISGLVNEMMTNDSFAPAFPVQNSGSGAPQGNGGGSKVPNPFQKGTAAYNVTDQAKMVKENPQLAKQFQKAAGQ